MIAKPFNLSTLLTAIEDLVRDGNGRGAPHTVAS